MLVSTASVSIKDAIQIKGFRVPHTYLHLLLTTTYKSPLQRNSNFINPFTCRKNLPNKNPGNQRVQNWRHWSFLGDSFSELVLGSNV
jgi:hypothetical protein